MLNMDKTAIREKLEIIFSKSLLTSLSKFRRQFGLIEETDAVNEQHMYQ